MNLFRSEEHIRNWAQYDAASEQGMISFDDLVGLFSCELFKRRMEPDYFSRRLDYRGGFLSIVTDMAKTRPFWSLPKP